MTTEEDEGCPQVMACCMTFSPAIWVRVGVSVTVRAEVRVRAEAGVRVRVKVRVRVRIRVSVRVSLPAGWYCSPTGGCLSSCPAWTASAGSGFATTRMPRCARWWGLGLG